VLCQVSLCCRLWYELSTSWGRRRAGDLYPGPGASLCETRWCLHKPPAVATKVSLLLKVTSRCTFTGIALPFYITTKSCLINRNLIYCLGNMKPYQKIANKGFLRWFSYLNRNIADFCYWSSDRNFKRWHFPRLFTVKTEPLRALPVWGVKLKRGLYVFFLKKNQDRQRHQW